MNSDPTSDFDLLDLSLTRLRARMPGTPIEALMLSRLLLHLGRGVAAMLEHQIRPFGLAEAELRVLTTLFSQPDGVAHPSELSARTSQSPANMSRISDALVRRDLITRVASAQDRRRLVLRITQQGEELVRRLLPLVFAPLREMSSELSFADQQQLIAQLKRLSVKLDQVKAEDRPPYS
jgi:DNA-binding MarR family transcriptional regulator